MRRAGLACEQALGRAGVGGGKRAKACKAAVAPRLLSCQTSANQHKPETRLYVTNMFLKAREGRSDFTRYANLMRF